MASRIEHSHLLAEPGCFRAKGQSNIHCGEEKNAKERAVISPIPEEFKYIPFNEEKHKEWEALLVKKLGKKLATEVNDDDTDDKD